MGTLQETKHVYMDDIIDVRELHRMIEAKRIKRTEHPELPLHIYNYTDLATYAGEWTQAERVCRGLIVESETGKIIARGPSKFFNYGEPKAKTYPLDTMVRVTKKEDGSLGIGWFYSVEPAEGQEDEWGITYGYGIATRGSFTSEQAEHATELLIDERGHNGRYELMVDFLSDSADGYVFRWDDPLHRYTYEPQTYIAEIVYPENRIVLDYGSRDELISLGTVDNATGLIDRQPTAPLMTLAEAIALPIPDDEEGYVLDILDAEGSTIDHLKLKGARYKELHAAIFGLTERKVWDAMVAGTIHDFIASLPDEVQPWAETVKERLAT